MKFPPLLVVLPCLLLSSCKDSKEKDKLEGAGIRELTGQDIEKIVSFSEQFARDAIAGDADAVSDAFDTRGYFLRSLDGIEFPPEEFEKFMTGVAEGLKERPGGVGWGFVGQNVKFLRVVEFEGMSMPLFRVLQEEGCDYVHLMALPDDSGQIRYYDTNMLSTGSWSSTTSRRLMLPIIKQLLGSKFERAFKKEEIKETAKNMEQVKAFNSANASGDIEKLQEIYQEFPESLQKERYMWTSYLGSLIDSPDEHIQEASKFENAFPDDPGVAFMLIDADFNRNDWDGAREKIERVKKALGGDAYLDILLANVELEAENYEAAIEASKNVIAAEPELEDAWWAAFVGQLKLKRYREFSDQLKGYQQEFGIELTVEDFAEGLLDDFLKAPEGQDHFGESE
jgi:hypothetical protein